MYLEWIIEGGLVMGFIIGGGLLALGVFVERSLHLHRARIRADDFIKGIRNIVSRGNIEEAVAICEETPGPVAYVAKTAILHRLDDRETLRTALQDASRAETSRMERRLVVVATVGQITPLLGLLGTILGMISSLVGMEAAAPLIHRADVLGGLRQALVTTAGGLSVAIPCYLAFNVLVVKIDRIVVDMERASSELVSFLSDLNPGAAKGATRVASPGL